MRTTEKTIRGGFTLAEILTTVAIIAILLAVLLPALNQVGKTAANVKQKAQFHAIEIALETFRSDKGDYPPSAFQMNPGLGHYTGSQTLAEAIIGRDGLGFHPSSMFAYDGKAAGNIAIYHPDIDTLPQADQDINHKSRKGPYLELENANAVKLSSLYANTGDIVDSYVLADAFKMVKHRQTGKKTGMPILYYRANRLGVGNNPAVANWVTNTYNLDDSYGGGFGIVSLKTPFSNVFHPLYLDLVDAGKWFYGRIQNPNFNNPARPYRAESFILHSAGPDGLYGTSDDVFNFDEEK